MRTLTDDGVWGQHPWGMGAADGRVLETTARMVRYFGYDLEDGDESVEFFLGHTRPDEFTPGGTRFWRFLGRRMSPALDAEILAMAATLPA